MWQCICLCWIKFNLTRFLDFYKVTTTYWTTRHKTKAQMLENVESVHFYLLEYMSHEQNVNSHLMVLQLTIVGFSFGGVQKCTVILHNFSVWFHFCLKIVGILPLCAHCLTLEYPVKEPSLWRQHRGCRHQQKQYKDRRCPETQHTVTANDQRDGWGFQIWIEI